MKGCGFHSANPANQFKPDKSGRKAGDKRGIGKRPQQPPCWIDLKWLPNKGDYSQTDAAHDHLQPNNHHHIATRDRPAYG